MALFFQGAEGAFVGRMGSVVGYRWKDRACLRSYRAHINYPNTVEQREQRDWFVAMVRFAAQAKEALRLGLKQGADTLGITEGNLFVKRNKPHFFRGKNGVEVNYKELTIAEGTAADVYFRDATFKENEIVEVEFEKNGMFSRASGEDMVYLYAYAPSLGCGMLSSPSARRKKKVSIMLPAEWDGVEVHLYGFVVDKQGRASKSTYIGAGQVNRCMDSGKYVPLNNNWREFVEMVDGVNTEKPRHGGEVGKSVIDDERRAESVVEPPDAT